MARKLDKEQLADVLKIDWTASPVTGASNSSPEYERLVAEVERLIRGDAHMLIGGRADRTAGLIMAQLAHQHGLAPKKVEVQDAEQDEVTNLITGTFLWSGIVFKFSAEPLVPSNPSTA